MMTTLPPQNTQVDTKEYPFLSRYYAHADGRMHYIDIGAGSPILFVHGTPTWSFEWRHLLKAFSATHRCIAPDFLGFGLSERPRLASYTPEAHAERLLALVDSLNLHDVTLVVHDYGGPIGLPVALAEATSVKRLVIFNTWMWSFADDPVMDQRGWLAGGAFGRFLYRHINFSLQVIMPSAYGDRSKLTPQIKKQYLDRFPDRWSRGAVLWPLAQALRGSSAFYEQLWSKRERLQHLPTLIIWGMKDTAFQPYMLAKWRSILPQATVEELANAGHWPHEEEPALVLRAMREFLESES
jgi:haloalkane dehalogenase